MAQKNKFILWFDQIRIDDIPLVSGKNASLGEMYQDLTVQGVKIPNGFATTSGAYWYLLEAAGILDKLKEALAGLDKKSDVKDLAEVIRLVDGGAEQPSDRRTGPLSGISTKFCLVRTFLRESSKPLAEISSMAYLC